MNLDEIKNDIATLEALAKKWKTASPTGQLQIAIGGIGQAIEFARHHINLTPAAPAPTGGSDTAAPTETPTTETPAS